MQFLIDTALILVYLCGFLLVLTWAWRFWLLYINRKFLNEVNRDSVLLEIKLPREIMKSPLAMETALAVLIQTSSIGDFYAKYFKGNLPLHFSLEIASLEGIIHFYIRFHKKFRTMVESNLYAQYPGIEIYEADDYTKLIRYFHLTKDVSLWGANFFLAKKWKPTNPDTGKPYQKSGKDYEMNADFLPIKTYVDFGLDKDPKEEFKTDPLTPIIEFMGTCGKGEYLWYQVLAQTESIRDGARKLPKFFVNKVTGKRFSLSDIAIERKKQIRTAGYLIKGEPVLDDLGTQKEKKIGVDKDGKLITEPATQPQTKAVLKNEMNLTDEEKDEVKAINKKLSKPLMCVVIRLVYVAKKESFKTGHVFTVLNAFKQFTGINSLALIPTDPYDYPWQNFMNHRIPWRAEEKFNDYVDRWGYFTNIEEREALDRWEDHFFWKSSTKNRRIFRTIYEIVFHPFNFPEQKLVSVLNLEEIATLWHFPGQVAGTPTLPRIDSTKGMAPVNLPQ